MKNLFFKIILLSILSNFILSNDYLILSLNVLSTSDIKLKIPGLAQKAQLNEYKHKLLVHGL